MDEGDRKKTQTRGCCWSLMSCFRGSNGDGEAEEDVLPMQAQVQVEEKDTTVSAVVQIDSAPEDIPDEVSKSPEPDVPIFTFCSPRRSVPSVIEEDSDEDVFEQAYNLSEEAEKALEGERKLKLSGQPEPVAPQFTRRDKRALAHHVHFPKIHLPSISAIPKWLKKQCVILAYLVIGSSPYTERVIGQETDDSDERNEIQLMVAQYAREQANLHTKSQFTKVSPQSVRGFTIDEHFADRNEPRRLRKTRSAPSLINAQEMTYKCVPIWPSLNHLTVLGPADTQLGQNDFQRAWGEWWNWRSKLYSVPYANTIESPDNYARYSKKNYLKGKHVKQLGDVGGKKRVVTTTRAESSASVSTTSALLATTSLPSTSRYSPVDQ